MGHDFSDVSKNSFPNPRNPSLVLCYLFILYKFYNFELYV